MSAPWVASDSRNACAAPWKSARIPGGISRRRSAAPIASTASPSETPGAVSNDSVTTGNCPWWAMTASRAEVSSKLAERRQRDLLARRCARTYSRASAAGVALVLGLDLEDHPVLVELREDERRLALTEGVVEHVVDLLRRHTEARGRVAVDDHGEREAPALQVARDVAQLGQRAARSSRRGAHSASSSGSASSSVYWYWVREARLSMVRSCTGCR